MAAPSISQSGAFHCIYPSWLLSQNFLPGYLHAKTTNNGNSFTYNSVYHSSTGIDDTLAKAGGRLVCDPVEDGHLVYILLFSA